MAGSFVFGRTVRANALAETVIPILIDSLVRSGYRLKSRPGMLPAELRWGSLALEVTMEFVPGAMLIPGVWKKSMPAQVTVSLLEATESSCVVRVASKPLLPYGEMAKPHFSRHVDQIVEALEHSSISAEADPITDTA